MPKTEEEMAERSHWFRKERTPSIAEASAAERDQEERARLHEEVAALPGQLASPPAVASEPEPEEVPVPRTPQAAAVPAAGLPLSRRSDATSSASSRAGSRELATADEDLWAELRASKGEQLRSGISRLKRSAGLTRPDDGLKFEYDWQKLWRFFAHEMVTGDERSGYLDKPKFKELLRKRASIQEPALINELWRIACPADGRLPFCRVVRPSAIRLRASVCLTGACACVSAAVARQRGRWPAWLQGVPPGLGGGLPAPLRDKVCEAPPGEAQRQPAAPLAAAARVGPAGLRLAGPGGRRAAGSAAVRADRGAEEGLHHVPPPAPAGTHPLPCASSSVVPPCVSPSQPACS